MNFRLVDVLENAACTVKTKLSVNACRVAMHIILVTSIYIYIYIIVNCNVVLVSLLKYFDKVIVTTVWYMHHYYCVVS